MSGTDKPAGKKRDHFLASAARYTAVASSLPASIAVGYVIGTALDSWFGTKFLYIVFLLLGVASGFVTLITVLMRDMREK
jgi:F0F1-type ATP synthase assembly protein I